MTFNSRQFRDALGHFATGITVVTTKVGSEPAIGLTANSFSSVSLDPPLILWSLDKNSETVATFEACEHFAINVLSVEQKDLSVQFSRRGNHFINGLDVETWKTGSPILRQAQASFDCTVHQRIDAGDHIIMLGQVEQVGLSGSGDPLLYHRGQYRQIDPTP